MARQAALSHPAHALVAPKLASDTARKIPRSWSPLWYLILAVHIGVLLNLAISWSPAPDEKAYLAGGLEIWKHGRFDLYCVNPPVPKLIASLPAFLWGADARWSSYQFEIADRPEFRCGDELVASYPQQWWFFLIGGRLPLLGFSAIGAWTCWRWSTDLYGATAGAIAFVLWCFCPNILSWNSVLGSDGLATSFGVAAAYSYWRSIKSPAWPRAFVAVVFWVLSSSAR